MLADLILSVDGVAADQVFAMEITLRKHRVVRVNPMEATGVALDARDEEPLTHLGSWDYPEEGWSTQHVVDWLRWILDTGGWVDFQIRPLTLRTERRLERERIKLPYTEETGEEAIEELSMLEMPLLMRTLAVMMGDTPWPFTESHFGEEL